MALIALSSRISKLETLIKGRSVGKAKVTFKDDNVQYLPLPDIIPLVGNPDSGIADISYMDSPGDGKLLELLRDLI